MAQYLVDFESYDLDVLPVGFTSRWGSPNADNKVIATPTWGAGLNAAFGTKVFQHAGGSASTDSIGFELTQIAGTLDDRITGLIGFNQASAPGIGVIFRGSGTGQGVGSTAKGYLVRFDPVFSKSIIVYQFDGSGNRYNTTVGSIDGVVDPVQFYFEAHCWTNASSQAQIDIYLWNIGGTKPINPNFTYTNTNYAAGWVGTGFFGNNASRSAFGVLGFGTNGDAAPLAVTRWGVRITGIKEPNVSDQLVTGVSNASLTAWLGGETSTAPSFPAVENQSITGGEMEVEFPSGDNTDSPVVIVTWSAGVGETKFFQHMPNIIDLDAV